jgi:hypothetical protein
LDRKTHNRLLQAARKISMSWAPRVAAKQKCKVDKALYQCQLCKSYVYEGKSPVTYDYYLQVYGDNVLFDNFHMDHKEPVVATNTDKHSWDIYYSRLFCPEENWQGICKPCHDIKSKAENLQRKIHKGKKK